MVDLDDPAQLGRQDPGGMAARIAEFPGAVASAWQAAQAFDLPPDFKSATSVVLTGMGGSAIGGDLVRSLADAESRIPIVVQRGYDLPAFAQRDTLVVAISHSGGTEETLSEAGEALRRGCKLLAITGGGTLGPEARQAGAPVFSFDYPYQPRAALGYLFVPLVAFLSRLGFLGDRAAQMDEAIGLLKALEPQLAPGSPIASNEAKRLAGAVEGRLPVIYGGGIMAEVAHRWKTQFNENSKAWAAYEVFPELNHNAVVGYERPRDFLDHVVVLLLQSSHEHPRVTLRRQVTGATLEQRGVKVEKVAARGEGDLGQMLSTILLGDYVSYYLAQLYQVDPTPVEAIDHLKEELAKAAA